LSKNFIFSTIVLNLLAEQKSFLDGEQKMPRGRKAAAPAAGKPSADDKLKAEVKELKGTLKEQAKLITALDKRLGKVEAKAGKAAPAAKAPGAKRGRKPKAAQPAPII
jgi:hypothetical protein